MWAHARPLAASHCIMWVGPLRTFTQFTQWAHGPTCNVHLHSLNGPMWAFTRLLVKIHMGFNDYYGINLLHGLEKRKHGKLKCYKLLTNVLSCIWCCYQPLPVCFFDDLGYIHFMICAKGVFSSPVIKLCSTLPVKFLYCLCVSRHFSSAIFWVTSRHSTGGQLRCHVRELLRAKKSLQCSQNNISSGCASVVLQWHLKTSHLLNPLLGHSQHLISLIADILTHRYTWICGSEGMFERSGHQSGHTSLQTPVLIPKLPDLLWSRILMDWTVLSLESYCNASSSGTDPITLRWEMRMKRKKRRGTPWISFSVYCLVYTLFIPLLFDRTGLLLVLLTCPSAPPKGVSGPGPPRVSHHLRFLNALQSCSLGSVCHAFGWPLSGFSWGVIWVIPSHLCPNISSSGSISGTPDGLVWSPSYPSMVLGWWASTFGWWSGPQGPMDQQLLGASAWLSWLLASALPALSWICSGPSGPCLSVRLVRYPACSRVPCISSPYMSSRLP